MSPLAQLLLIGFAYVATAQALLTQQDAKAVKDGINFFVGQNWTDQECESICQCSNKTFGVDFNTAISSASNPAAEGKGEAKPCKPLTGKRKEKADWKWNIPGFLNRLNKCCPEYHMTNKQKKEVVRGIKCVASEAQAARKAAEQQKEKATTRGNNRKNREQSESAQALQPAALQVLGGLAGFEQCVTAIVSNLQ